ncbi:hypothetical protein [Floridanema aerugineum]|uniref:Integral membrane protein n=1 Tax=Floridaenema aerugineum BLCC-F46 TaxID=3153654 RepID=A0ABV4X4P5_9CYAN
MNDKQQMLEVYLKEYEKLKDEQTQRIGFRDNLLYVTLGVFGAVISFALANKTNYYALLVIPWVCLILGWTYLVNDEKISALGRYIRLNLVEKIKEQTGHTDIESIFGWEIVHRSDRRRKRRKIEQLIIDEITFVFSGVIALVAFRFLVTQFPVTIHILWWADIILLLILGVEIVIYADLAEGR